MAETPKGRVLGSDDEASFSTPLKPVGHSRRQSSSAHADGKPQEAVAKISPSSPGTPTLDAFLRSKGAATSPRAEQAAGSRLECTLRWPDLQTSSEESKAEAKLRAFDMNVKFGPCVGISRLERFQRAENLGLKPPIAVFNILQGIENRSPVSTPPSKRRRLAKDEVEVSHRSLLERRLPKPLFDMSGQPGEIVGL